jgi:hypothetical protein
VANVFAVRRNFQVLHVGFQRFHLNSRQAEHRSVVTPASDSSLAALSRASLNCQRCPEPVSVSDVLVQHQAAQSRRSPRWPDWKAAMHRHSWNWSRRSLRWPDLVGLAPNCRRAQRPSGTTARLSSWAGFAATACGRRLVGAEGTAAPSMLSVPAAAPAGKLTPSLTTSPAPENVSFAVTLRASSTAGGEWLIARRFASFRAGPVPKA